MNKIQYILFFLLAISMSGCLSQPLAPDNIVHNMLSEQITFLEQNKLKVEVIKEIWYAGEKSEIKDSAGAVIDVLKSIKDMEPGRLLKNTGFHQKEEQKTIDDFKLLTLKLEKDEAESSTFQFMDIYKKCEKEDCNEWLGFYLLKKERNYLYHSNQTFMLRFKNNKITELVMRTREKSMLSNAEDFRMRLKIRYL